MLTNFYVGQNVKYSGPAPWVDVPHEENAVIVELNEGDGWQLARIRMRSLYNGSLFDCWVHCKELLTTSFSAEELDRIARQKFALKYL